MKLRSLFLSLAAGSLIVLLIAGTGLYWILANSPLKLLQGSQSIAPQAAIFVPKQAPFMVSLLVNPDRLQAFREVITTPTERGKATREFKQLKKNILQTTGFNYNRDLQPWLGEEITFALTSLDFDRNQSNGNQPGYLLAMQNKNPELARRFVQSYFSKKAIADAAELVFEQYKGVNLIYRRTEPLESTLVSAVVGDFVLLANHPKVLRNAITNIQVTDLSLQNANYYQQSLATITEPGIGFAFVNLPKLLARLVEKPTPELNRASQILTTEITLNRQGLLAQTAFPGSNETNALEEPVDALKYVPSDSIFSVSGVNLKQLWEKINHEPASGNILSQVVQKYLTNLEENWGFNLAENFLNLVSGEYALALLPNEDSNLDWLFALPSDRQAITNLDELAELQGLSTGKVSLGSQEVTIWTQLLATASSTRIKAQVQAVHTSIDDYEIFASSITALETALTTDTPLVASNKFQRAISPLPQNNNEYIYLDWQASRPILAEKLPVLRLLESVAQPLLKHLESLTLTSNDGDEGINRASIFFKLG